MGLSFSWVLIGKKINLNSRDSAPETTVAVDPTKLGVFVWGKIWSRSLVGIVVGQSGDNS